jgi:biotin carboxylase
VGSLIVLGGADGAITTVRAARRIGLRTVCVDQRTDAPASRWADEYCNVSTRDVPHLVEVFAPRRDVVGVVSPASDVNLPTQDALARGLGLPTGLSPDALRASVDKGFFRDVCEELGLPGPRYVQGPPERVLAEATGLRFPVIVKPTDSSGGRGIGTCAAPGELGPAVAEAVAYSAAGVVIVEEYLAGRHHTAEAIVVDGRIALLGVGDRVLTAPPYFVTVEHRMPSRSPELAGRLRVMLDAICARLDYRWGSLNVDVLVTADDRVVLVEMGARLGGNGSAELLGLVHGLDVTEASTRLAVGDRPALVPTRAGHAAFRVLSARRPGKLVAIEGVDAARALPGVVDLVIAAQPGDHVEPYHRAGAKLGYVMVAAADPRQLETTLDTVDRVLTVDVLDAEPSA